jgi:1-acyl-sn-glycerol-3-phosphate acyltransferase
VQAVALRYPHAADPCATHPAAPFVGEMDLLGHIWRLLGATGLDAHVQFCAPLRSTGDRRELAHTTRVQVQNALGLQTPDPASLQTLDIARG